MKQAEQEAEARRLARVQEQHWQVNAGRWSLGSSPGKALEMTRFRFTEDPATLAQAKLDEKRAAQKELDDVEAIRKAIDQKERSLKLSVSSDALEASAGFGNTDVSSPTLKALMRSPTLRDREFMGSIKRPGTADDLLKGGAAARAAPPQPQLVKPRAIKPGSPHPSTIRGAVGGTSSAVSFTPASMASTRPPPLSASPSRRPLPIKHTPSLPVPLPHKFDFIVLAYDRCPDYRRKREQFQRSLSEMRHLKASEARDRALGKLPPRPTAGGAMKRGSTSVSAASLRQLSEQQIAPRPRSSELFDEADVGLLPEVRRMLREAYRWPELASRDVNPTAMLMRARSETTLSLSLSKYGTRRLWS